MKVLMINGSPNSNGCTYTALEEIATILHKEGIETEIIQTGKEAIRDCIGCGACRNTDGMCIFKDDIVNEIIEKAKTADGFIVGSPVYFAHPSGRILSILDRVFYAGKKAFLYKPAAAVVSARRAGTTASLDVLYKYFTLNNMPIVSSNYWAMVHGNKPDEIKQDLEGMQIIQGIGTNMAWLLKSLKAAKDAGIETPKPVEKIKTNFIR